MSSIPSASTFRNNRPIFLPPPEDLSGPQHRSSHNQIRPSNRQRSSTLTQQYQRTQISSLSSRPAHPSSSRGSFIPSQTGASFSHWAAQDPFDSPAGPRRLVQLSSRPSSLSSSSSRSRPSEPRRAFQEFQPPSFVRPRPSIPAGSVRRHQSYQQRQNTSYISSATSATSRTSSSPEPATDMPAQRQTRKRRATNDLTASSPSDSPAPSTRTNKRRATRTSTASSSSDRPVVSSFRAAAVAASAAQPKRTAPLRRTNTKIEPLEAPIVFDESSEGEGEAEYKVIDLVDKDEVPEPEPEPGEEKNAVRLSAFQCVICMDDVTALTVTHCGMSFAIKSRNPIPFSFTWWLTCFFAISRPPLLLGMPALLPPHRRQQEGLSHLPPESRDQPRGRQVHLQVQRLLAAGAEAYDEQAEWEEGCAMMPPTLAGTSVKKPGDALTVETDAVGSPCPGGS